MSGTHELLRSYESWFEPNPWLPASRRGALEAQLEQLKERLLQPIIATLVNTELVREFSSAANEAAALAWFTVCPILVLPDLLEEKIRLALGKWEKQQQLRCR